MTYRTVAIVAAALGIASGAGAATITRSINYAAAMAIGDDGRNYNGTVAVEIPQFDEMNGARTLTQVTLRIVASTTASASAENNEAVPGTFDVGYPILFVATGPGNLQTDAAFAAANSPVANLAASDGMPNQGPDYTNFGPFTGLAETDDIPTTALLNPYLGTGTFRVDVSGSGTINRRGTLQNVTLTTASISLAGAVTVTYEYSTAPAPCTCALAVGASLHVLRRRRAR